MVPRMMLGLRRSRCRIMRIISFNVRGLGGSIKKSAVRELVVNEKVDFMCVQETKLDRIDDRLAFVLWGNKECDWVFSGAEGASGGLCCLWDKAVFQRTELWGHKGVLGVAGIWKGIPVNIVNIYAPCNAEGKRRIWAGLEEKMKGGNEIGGAYVGISM